MGFDTPGILRDILERMERDFGLNRLSLHSNILTPLHQFSRDFSDDDDDIEKYTSLPTFSDSAKAELMNDVDDWWRLPLQRRRKFRSKLFPTFHERTTRSFNMSPDRHPDFDLKNERSSFDDLAFGKHRANRRAHTSPKYFDGQHCDANRRTSETTSIPITISSAFNKDTGQRAPSVGRSRSVPLQDLEYLNPPRPRSVPSDISFPLSALIDIQQRQKIPEVSQKFDELRSKNEEIKRPTVPDSLLPVGPEIKVCNAAHNSNQPDITMTAKSNQNQTANIEGNKNCENNNQSGQDVNEHLRKLLSDLCFDAQRNSLPPVICDKGDLFDEMHKEFRSESLPDIVKCDTRTLNGKVPRFSFRSGENLPWSERQQRIEGALSWLRSELVSFIEFESLANVELL